MAPANLPNPSTRSLSPVTRRATRKIKNETSCCGPLHLYFYSCTGSQKEFSADTSRVRRGVEIGPLRGDQYIAQSLPFGFETQASEEIRLDHVRVLFPIAVALLVAGDKLGRELVRSLGGGQETKNVREQDGQHHEEFFLQPRKYGWR